MAPLMPTKTGKRGKPLILYPAIDLKGGRCVRLSQGDFDKATVYDVDPADQAKIFVSQGFSWIHVVDLDGSVEGKAVNGAAVASILKTASIPVQLGGGVRNMAAVERWLEAASAG
jgi:phosphoribosylformimino-5-aminoimidazole carboxamide ribotide isomerase